MADDSGAAVDAVTTQLTDNNNNKTPTSTSIFLQIVEHPDGRSVTRPTVPNIPPSDNLDDKTIRVYSKDVPLNSSLNTSLRLYLPNLNLHQVTKKLPVVVYYHGGGFVLFSPAFVLYHQFCQQLASTIPALVVSLDYRLAPENPLPAAYDDAVEAIHWVRQSTDPWIAEHGDLSRCFVMGSSSGGNMAYHACLMRAARMQLDPVKLCGVVLIQPYFGGENRTRSETESEDDDILPLRANEMMWRMALPQGADRDHEYCNPISKSLDSLRVKTMVMGCAGDPLFDRQKMFVGMLSAPASSDQSSEAKLVDRLEEKERGYHAIELFDPVKAEAMCADIREFVRA